jgi:amino acid adenylation domain-containing protein
MSQRGPSQVRSAGTLLRRKTSAAATDVIPRLPAGSRVPLSPPQERIWLAWKKYPESPEYNEFEARSFEQAPDRAALADALRTLMLRHDALRLRVLDVGGVGVQEDSGAFEPRVEWHDLRDLPAAEARQRAESINLQAAARPLPVAEPPLFRVVAVLLPGNAAQVAMVLNPLICDRWSRTRLVDELSTLLSGAPLTARSGSRYLDYVAWAGSGLNKSRQKRAMDYWKAKLGGDLPVLDLPGDRPRPTTPSGRSGFITFDAPPALAKQVTRFAAGEGAAPFSILLAAYQAFLARLTGQADLVVGTLLAGRDHPDTENMVGCFLNPTALRASLSDWPPFRELVRSVRQTVAEAEGHQGVPYEQVAAALATPSVPGVNPVFQTFIAQAPAGLGIGGRIAPMNVGDAPGVDLSMMVAVTGEKLTGQIEYSADLFDEPTIQRFSRMYLYLLNEGMSHAARSVRQLALISADERQRIVADLNDYGRPDLRYRTLTEPFEEQVGRTPDAVAIIDGDECITYAELNARANQLARYLRAQGAVPGTKVAVCLERDAHLVIVLYAIIKSGAAYVPLDPELPDKRVAFVLEDTEPILVLTHSRTAARIPAGPWRLVSVADDSVWSSLPPDNLPAGRTAADLLYVLYTSGSTGRPKGVAYPVDGALANMFWLQERYPFRPGDTAILKTSYGFDVSIWELFWPLYFGARVVVARPGGHRDPGYLRELIERHHVSTIFFVPTMLRVFLDHTPAGSSPSLQWVFCGGEPWPARLRDAFHGRFGAALINCCGPTEAGSVVDMIVPRDDGSPVVPLGRPARNFRAYLLDDEFSIVPVGVPAELFVGGETGLAWGYHRRPSHTAERFIPDPFGTPGARMYRTGDLCRYRGDGVLEHLGRIDRQVKVGGIRVELAEIESVLSEHPAVRETVVLPLGDSDERLAAFVVPSEGTQVSAHALSEHARRLLPAQLVPTAIMPVTHIPANINGKIDQEALLSAIGDVSADDEDASVPPEGELEARLASIFQRVLGVEEISVTDSFFVLGGHSLLVFRLIAACAAELSIRPTVADVFAAPSVRELAQRLNSSIRERDRTLVPLSASTGKAMMLLIHAASGSILPFREIASRLSTEFDVYGVQAADVPGGERASVEDMAVSYVTAIHAVRGTAPLIAVGWSVGGCIALEMTREWQRQGVHVAATVMLDTWLPPALIESPSVAAQVRAAVAGIEIGPEVPGAADSPGEVARLQRLLERNRDAFLGYRPQRFHGRAFLLRAVDQHPDPRVRVPEAYLAGDRGWGSIVDDIVARDIPGDHFSLITQQHAAALAVTITDIARSQMSSGDA